jgi:hypothetical protein
MIGVLGAILRNFDSGVQTVHHGHGKIEKNQVGRKLLNEVDALFSIFRLTANPKTA